MASTHYIDAVTHIEAEWANDTDAVVYAVFNASKTPSDARTALGLSSMALQASNNVSITGGLLDNTPIGSITPSTGVFSTVTLNSAITVGSQATTKTYVDNKVSTLAATLGTLSTQNANAVAITGGTLNGVVIGGVTPAAGTFTTLQTAHVPSVGADVINLTYFNAFTATLPLVGTLGLQDSDSVTITGGTLDGVIIGATTPEDAVFTSVTSPQLIGPNGTVYLDGNAPGIGSGGAVLKATGSSKPDVFLQMGAGGNFALFASNGAPVLFTNSGRFVIGAISDDGTNALQVNGSTKTTQVVLGNAPTSNSHAATKLYVDSAVSTINGSIATINGTLTTLGTIATQDANTVAITGGGINGTTIGASVPSTGQFTSLATDTVSNVLSGSLIDLTTDAGYGMQFSVSQTLSPKIGFSILSNGSVDFSGGSNYVMSVLGNGRILMGGAADDGTSVLNVLGDLAIEGNPKFIGTVTTGVGTPLLGANCPASVLTAPRAWVQVKILTDTGLVTGWMPVWH